MNINKIQVATLSFIILLCINLIPLRSVYGQLCYDSNPVGDPCTACPPGSPSYIQGGCGNSGSVEGKIPVTNPIAAQSVPALINSIVSTILGVVGAIALAMFVYGGLMWMTSAGNSQRIEKGKETLLWATIGLLIIFLSYGILNVILRALSGSGA